jgi:hypothetical protein
VTTPRWDVGRIAAQARGTVVAQLLESAAALPPFGEEFAMTRFHIVVGIFAVMAGSGLGCTANVENPKLNQNANDNEAMCTKTCDDAQTTCVAKCTDDGCKASCTTDHDHCVTACSPADGG